MGLTVVVRVRVMVRVRVRVRVAWGVWYRACFSSSYVYGYEWDVI